MKISKLQRGEIFGVVDLGSYSIKVMIASLGNDNKLQVLAIEEYHPSEGIEAGIITNMEKAANAVKNAITRAEKTPNVNVEKVIVVFSEKSISYDIRKEIITFPEGSTHEIKEEDLDRLWEKAINIPIEGNKSLIHLLPISYDIDHRRGIKDPVGMTSSRLEGNFILLTASKNNAENVIKCIERAGYVPVDLMIQGIPSSFHLTSNEEKALGVGVIQMGDELTSISVYKEGRLIYYFELLIGGRAITKDIQEVCELPNRADEVKRMYGVAYSNSLPPEDQTFIINDIPGQMPKKISRIHLSEVIQARAAQIFALIEKAIEMEYNNNASEVRNPIAQQLRQISAGFIITGGQARMDGIKEIAESITGRSIRIGKPSINKLDGLPMKANDPAYSSIVGAAFYHFESKWYSPFIIQHKNLLKKNKKNNNTNNWLTKLQKFLSENLGDIVD